jgi:PAS domain S-box-containing protein
LFIAAEWIYGVMEKNMCLMRQGKSRQKAFGILYATLFLLLSNSPSHAEGNPAKHLLILHSFLPSLGWTEAVMKGVQEGLIQSGEPVQLQAEYLDTRRFSGPEHRIPIIRREVANKFLFDSHELSRFGLTAANLPEGGEDINNPSSSYVISKEFIWGGLISLGTLFCAIVLLAVNILAKKKADKVAHLLAHEKAVMAEIGRIISSTLNIEEIYGRFGEEVRKLIPFDRIMVSLNNSEEGTAAVTYVSGIGIEERKIGNVYPLHHSANEEVIRTRSGVLIQPETVEELEPRFSTLIPTFRSGLRSMMTVPLISADQVFGALHFRSRKTKAYTDRDVALAERIGDQIAAAIAHAQLFAERKLAEQSLRESERKFRDLYDHAPLGYHEYDAEGRITNVNRTDLDMLGYTAEEMIGKFMWEFNTEAEIAHKQILAKLAGTLPPGRNLERTYRRKDGTTFPVLIEDRLIVDEKGRIQGIRCTIQDITDRKKAEKERDRLAQENAIMAEIGRVINSTLNIEEVYERFAEEVKKLISFDRIAINLHDTQNNAIHVAHAVGPEILGPPKGAVTPLWGSPAEEILRTKSGILGQIEDPKEFGERFPSLVSAIQAGVRSILSVPLFSKGEVIGILSFRSGTPKAYSERDLRLAERVGNQIAGAIANARLFAERKRAEEKLRRSQEILEMRVQERTEDLVKAKDAADAANRAKSDFLANMSHELRTPLNHIIGFTELVVDKQCGELNEAQDEYLNDVLHSSRHLLSLINDILDLSKVEAGKLELQMTGVHLRILLQNSLSMVKEKAMKHGIQLQTDVDGIPEEIQADERKLKQILYNLLSNAVKFTPDGGSVTLSAWHLSLRDGQWITGDQEAVFWPLHKDDKLKERGRLIGISVQDTGIGVKWEDLERIFAPFEQGDNSASRRYQGTGLGLSLTKRLVELHGGRIWAESEGEGKGSKVTLVIPG